MRRPISGAKREPHLRRANRPDTPAAFSAHAQHTASGGSCWIARWGDLRYSWLKRASMQVRRYISLIRAVPSARIELATHGLGNRCSIP